MIPELASLPDSSSSSEPRYGWGRPEYPHFSRLCEANRASIAELLRSFLPFKDHLLQISQTAAAGSADPFWNNDWFPPLDAISLYAVLAVMRPERYIEVGSGHSTRFARRAVKDQSLPTSITSIDPQPRIEIAAVADRVIASPLENLDLEIFKALRSGDVLFVDSSHQAFMNSDVTVVFLDVLPMLSPGVIVHFHDIHLPYDYPREWAPLYYNEQYLLAAYMLGGNRLRLLLPNAFITRDPQLHQILDPIWKSPAMAGLPVYGASLWGRIIGSEENRDSIEGNPDSS